MSEYTGVQICKKKKVILNQ